MNMIYGQVHQPAELRLVFVGRFWFQEEGLVVAGLERLFSLSKIANFQGKTTFFLGFCLFS